MHDMDEKYNDDELAVLALIDEINAEPELFKEHIYKEVRTHGDYVHSIEYVLLKPYHALSGIGVAVVTMSWRTYEMCSTDFCVIYGNNIRYDIIVKLARTLWGLYELNKTVKEIERKQAQALWEKKL